MTEPGVSACVQLFWLPLGAGGHGVRWNGKIFEAWSAHRQRRPRRELYHSALVVQVSEIRTVVEMAPAWGPWSAGPGVVSVGAVGAGWLGRSRLFRYEVRCWRDGVIPDVAYAVASPQTVSEDLATAIRVLQLVPQFPTGTWGRDELGTDDMWNSNSLVAWLLACSGHDMAKIGPPRGGRAPGWTAGLAAARAATAAQFGSLVPPSRDDRLIRAGGRAPSV